MLSVHKILSYRQKSEGGFVLIAALMAVMVLMAVGFFILTTTSQDIRMSSRLVGERKAMSAAEAGAHEVLRLLNPLNPTLTPPQPLLPPGIVLPPGRQVDTVNDPTTWWSVPPTYTDATGTRPNPVQNTSIPTLPKPGSSLTECGANFDTVVNGQDRSYGVAQWQASIHIGTTYLPFECGSSY